MPFGAFSDTYAVFLASFDNEDSAVEWIYINQLGRRKFGGSLRSKARTAQINEALCKIIAHNICVLIQSMHEF